MDVRRLPWDSAHFGLAVAQFDRPDLPAGKLAEALRQARGSGVDLVYWPAHPDCPVPPELLREFHGRLADRKVTYRKEPLGPDTAVPPPDGLRVGPYESPEVSPLLLQLALTSGGHSRFLTDPRLPRRRAEELYEIWIARSVRGELAHVVLVASPAGEPADLRGMVTASVHDGVGQIGLIAVRPDAQKAGVGCRLMRAAHEFMRRGGAGAGAVVTQGANAAACRLYERSGYRLASVVHFYHFWVGDRSGGATPAAA